MVSLSPEALLPGFFVRERLGMRKNNFWEWEMEKDSEHLESDSAIFLKLLEKSQVVIEE